MANTKIYRSLGFVFLLFTAAWAAPQGGAGQVFQGPMIEELLKTGKITGMKSLPEGVTLPKKATLEINGEKLFGVWKTIDEGPVPTKQLDSGVELQFQDSWRTEIAAYELDKLIGFGMVPATVPRTFDGKQGSMQFFVDSVMTETQRYEKKIQPPNQNAGRSVDEGVPEPASRARRGRRPRSAAARAIRNAPTIRKAVMPMSDQR